MFSIFQKKTYLVDLLEGFTDFHNHILPGLDDGSASVEDSLNIIREFKSFGVDSFMATPHVMGDYYPNTPSSITNALNLLKNKLPDDVKIGAAAEYMMDQHFLEILQKEKLLSISDQNVLVEMSFFQAPINLNEILFKIQNNGYKPILAHPERYSFFHSTSLEDYSNVMERGCLLQLNILSLTPHYGKNIQHIANRLLEKGFISFISSDAHRMEHLEKIKNIRLTKKQLNFLEPVIDNSKNLF